MYQIRLNFIANETVFISYGIMYINIQITIFGKNIRERYLKNEKMFIPAEHAYKIPLIYTDITYTDCYLLMFIDVYII